MKKKHFAALMLFSFAANAQAQSSMSIYGLVDLGLAKTSGKTLIVRENHASRLGIRGVENLGGGLSAVFNLEIEILADTGAHKGALFERQANVGVRGGFGTAYLGRTKNLVDSAQNRVEPFATDGVVGKVNEAMMRGGVGVSRVSNSLTYVSPSLSGLVISAQAVASEVTGAHSGFGVLATYDNGPISMHAGYESTVQTMATLVEPTLWVVGGGYKIGPAKVTAAYSKGDTGVGTTGTFNSYLVGLVYTIGQGDAKAGYGNQTQSNSRVSNLNTVKELGIGYDYHLSKRTDLYAYAGRERVKSLTSIQLGLSHKF
ncbi:porin [Massilia sp. H6]|uniref:porin n=1 Tax=Massilia sp. H6 TaxID=2970464 RepID=UPI002167153D|nr:porin [Massilia sp. H6]UVW29282.1 porin [Massilia sp. H6]